MSGLAKLLLAEMNPSAPPSPQSASRPVASNLEINKRNARKPKKSESDDSDSDMLGHSDLFPNNESPDVLGTEMDSTVLIR